MARGATHRGVRYKSNQRCDWEDHERLEGNENRPRKSAKVGRGDNAGTRAWEEYPPPFRRVSRAVDSTRLEEPAFPVDPSLPLLDSTSASILHARNGVSGAIARLAAQGMLDWEKVFNARALIRACSQARGVADMTAGVLPLLDHLLDTQPQAFAPKRRKAKSGGVGERGPPAGGAQGNSAGGDPSISQLIQQLAADENACYVVASVNATGIESVWCNDRMSELFISSEGGFGPARRSPSSTATAPVPIHSPSSRSLIPSPQSSRASSPRRAWQSTASGLASSRARACTS